MTSLWRYPGKAASLGGQVCRGVSVREEPTFFNYCEGKGGD